MSTQKSVRIRRNTNTAELAEILQGLDQNRNALANSVAEFEELATEVYDLRREVIRLRKLISVRERERDSVKEAHRRRLQQAKHLRKRVEELRDTPKLSKQKKETKKSFAIAASPLDDED